MDWSSLVNLLPFILRGIDLATKINDERISGEGATAIVRKELPAVFDLFAGVGKTLFPDLSQGSQVAAAAVVLSADTTKRVQGQLNKLGASPQLVVDGSYGRLTKAAVTTFQQANPPLVADGWAGAETQKALDAKAPA